MAENPSKPEEKQMDDEDSKIRRNLVVASMLILLAVWLRAPLDGLAETLFKVKPSGPTFAWRVWMAAGAALTYFALRFRFSDDNDEAIKRLRAEYVEVERRVLGAWFAREFARYVRKGEMRSLRVGGLSMLAEARLRFIDHKQGGSSNAKLSRIKVKSATRDAAKNPPYLSLKHVIVKVNLGVSSDKGEVFAAAEDWDYELTRSQRAWIRALAFGWMCVYSRGSTAILLPWLLAGLAFAAAIYKIVRTW